MLSTRIHSSSVEESGSGRVWVVPLFRRRSFSLRRGNGRKYVGLIEWPTRWALPIQERWVCGRTTETVWPCDWSVETI